ncbi:MAG TPA: CHAT domain-containing protein [Spirochaetota bacterium]|nr:DUF1887 family protein [Spirochaetota bacterium]HOM87635.1 CHAT domain-containing protein [Spirochaetota bacterium]HOR93562.1 CHAT domain-containing protein [Spirochaetota bacterium]HPD04462.1 CHAT domain-containing protein [Spirochaetota bacterium]HQG41985.1 CHAT domain-containing protein [Spirochaetota bacterium]
MTLTKQWNNLPKKKRYSFYTEEILPVISQSLHNQLSHYLLSEHAKPYSTVITILSPNIHPVLLMLNAILPHHCVLLYTPEKEQLLQQIKHHCATRGIELHPVELSPTNHQDNITIMQRTIKEFSKKFPPVLCDITSGKKIMSTQIGIIASSLKLDIAYIDSNKQYLESGIPQPGSEILYIQKASTIIEFSVHDNVLRIAYDDNNNTMRYECYFNDCSYKLGTKKIHSNDIEQLSNLLSSCRDDINYSISHSKNYTVLHTQSHVLTLCSLLFSRELTTFLKTNCPISNMRIIADEEVASIPWELVLSHYGIQLPIVRIPNRDKEFSEPSVYSSNKKIIIIFGSSNNIPDFNKFEQNIKMLASSHNAYNITTVEAASASNLKVSISKHFPCAVIIYYGHAVFSTTPETTGLVCRDGSIFSIDDCEIFHASPPQCMVVNACQSASGSLFLKNSFAYAVLKMGVATYIGTNFFLEAQRSFVFIKTFLKNITSNTTYYNAYASALQELQKNFGNDDIALYNYVYYGN